MSFFQLYASKRTNIVQKQRISLVVQYSIDSFFVFYKDQSFQQINNHNDKIINQGKLQFVPFQWLNLEFNHRIVLLGVDKANNLYCAVIDVSSQCQIQSRLISNLNPQKTTKFQIYECDPTQEGNFFLIMIQKNIQNGLAIATYDFQNNLWNDQMLGLPSKFLNFFFINSMMSNQLYKEVGQKQCFTFVLAALGDKFDSINYSKIKIYYEMKEGDLVLKLTFIITRQIKVASNFVLLGGAQFKQDSLLIVGNSKVESQKPSYFINVPAFIQIDTRRIQNNEPQQIIPKPIEIKKYQERVNEINMRRIIGIFQDNIIAQLRIGNKQKCIVRINQKCQEEIIEIPAKNRQISFSAKKDSLYSYDLHCQYFFEKIKGSPSKIDTTLMRIGGKMYQQACFLKFKYGHLNDQFILEVQKLL